MGLIFPFTMKDWLDDLFPGDTPEPLTVVRVSDTAAKVYRGDEEVGRLEGVKADHAGQEVMVRVLLGLPKDASVYTFRGGEAVMAQALPETTRNKVTAGIERMIDGLAGKPPDLRATWETVRQRWIGTGEIEQRYLDGALRSAGVIEGDKDDIAARRELARLKAKAPDAGAVPLEGFMDTDGFDLADELGVE